MKNRIRKKYKMNFVKKESKSNFIFSFLKLHILFFVVIGCQTPTNSNSSNQYQKGHSDEELRSRPLVEERYTLAHDQQELEKLREQIPDTKKKQNDESAFILNLMADQSVEPGKIRQQFDYQLRKKRELFEKDMKKERENFTFEERKKRDLFLKELNEQRQIKLKNKISSSERSDFFKEQEQQKSIFFANEREKRQDFESDVRERRKNFEDYVKDRQGTFQQEFRSYQQSYQQRKTNLANQKKEDFSKNEANVKAEQESLETELNEAKKKKGVFLGP